MKQVIFDTDPGIDDAMAMLFLHLAADVELVAVVTGFGNARLNGGEDRNGMDVDTLVIGFDFFGAGGKVDHTGDQINFSLGDETMVTVNFEQFNINGVLFPANELPIV